MAVTWRSAESGLAWHYDLVAEDGQVIARDMRMGPAAVKKIDSWRQKRAKRPTEQEQDNGQEND